MDNHDNGASSHGNEERGGHNKEISPAPEPSGQLHLSEALKLATHTAISEYETAQLGQGSRGSWATTPVFFSAPGYPLPIPSAIGYPVPTTSSQLPPASELTQYCGIFSPAKGADRLSMTAQRLTDPKFKYHCPRCDKRFSRRFTVKQHFPACINKYGNPQSLKWLDHASLNDSPGGCHYAPRRKNAYNMRRGQEVRQRSSLPANSQYNVVPP